MKIIKSKLFSHFNRLAFGVSARFGEKRPAPFYFNLSYTVGDEENIVKQNRKIFFKKAGFKLERAATQNQIHSDIVTEVDEPGYVGDSDALITDKPNIALVVSLADCVNIYLYDKRRQVIAAVHSGWRGSQKKILSKTLKILRQKYLCSKENLFVFVGPSISQKNYEVGPEVAALFDAGYTLLNDGKFYLDVQKINIDILNEFGIPKEQIEVFQGCTFDDKHLHSYRRDGNNSGRMLGAIMMRDFTG